MTPKISIIIPVYNVEQYLSRCLDSIINQTLKEIEIICINDGSTDGSLDILNEYQKKDNRIQIFSIENNGVSFARNLGIKKAKGIFIGFCDSDDYVDTQYFEFLYSFSKNKDLIRGIRVFDEKGTHSKNPYGCVIPSIVRKKILIDNNIYFPLGISKGEDTIFKELIYKNTKRIFECPDKKIYYHYMRRKGTLSNYNFSWWNEKKATNKKSIKINKTNKRKYF